MHKLYTSTVEHCMRRLPGAFDLLYVQLVLMCLDADAREVTEVGAALDELAARRVRLSHIVVVVPPEDQVNLGRLYHTHAHSVERHTHTRQ